MTHPLAPLQAVRQWIVVRLVPKADGKTDKLPIDWRTKQVSNAHDPSIWLDYPSAFLVAATIGAGHTVGFVLTAADPFWCLDIDKCLQPDGTWSALSQSLCSALPNTVVELSQSGTGLHIWGQGPIPEHACRNSALDIELYHEERFIAIGTGQTGSMSTPCPAIAAVVETYFKPAEASGHEVPEDGPRADWRGPPDTPDGNAELLRRALKAKSLAAKFGEAASFADLYYGEESALGKFYPGDPYNRSGADAALFQHLMYWTGCDMARALRIAQGSALKRDKWDRQDYIHRTLRKAASQQKDVLQDPLPPGQSTDAVCEPQATSSDSGSGYLVSAMPLTVARIFMTEAYPGGKLKRWQGSFYRWQGGAWSEASDDDIRAALYQFIDSRQQSDFQPTQTKVSNVVDALKSAAHLDSTTAPPCWIEGQPYAPAADLVAVANGLLHLRSRTLHPPTARLFNRNALPVAYRPDTGLPIEWLSFLAQVWPGDTESIDALQEVFGYLLTPDTSQHKAFLIIGPPRSGKGTIGRVLSALLGAANVAGPTLASLAGNFGLEPLVGKLVAVMSDARLSGRPDQQAVAENLLRISGEDQIEVDRKHRPSLALRLGVRIVMFSNEVPGIADASGAMASRFVILKMTESFLGREDPGLTTRLLAELPAIFLWAVEGWHRLNARGYFITPQSARDTAQELSDLGSPVTAFVRDACWQGAAAEVRVDSLYDAWCAWCIREGKVRAGDKSYFGRNLKAAMPSIRIRQPRGEEDRIRVYSGIGLRSGTGMHGQFLTA